jgi:phosphatidate cytidylyltransferase
VNSVAENGDTGRRSARANSNNLRLRLVSGLILAPPAVAAAYAGTPWFDLLVAGLAGVMGVEWAALTGGTKRRPVAVLVGGAATAAVLLTAAAGAWLGGLAIVAAVLAALGGARVAWPGRGAWAAAGVLWLALPCVATVWLRADPVAGRETVLWLLAAVWATDIGAYITGRGIGGPRLAPAISPGKTWAGLVGGIVASAAVGGAAAWLLAADRMPLLALLGGALAITAQAGDLAESKLKRHFGAKDSGYIIPGHGGVLDRLDGMLAAALMLALLEIIMGGSPFAWP